MSRLVIIDYGSGNLHSAVKSFERAASEAASDMEICLSSDPADVSSADRIVLPGVGAFGDCKEGLANIPGMLDALNKSVIEGGRPFLGICVGMQLMATRGLEHGSWDGLGWIDGEVRAIEPDDASLKIPHMGWNTLDLAFEHPVLSGIKTGAQGLHAYFVHSYHFVGASDDTRLAVTDYGGPVTAMIARDNMVGTQFHPEKSQKLGLKLISNFLKWRC